MFAARSRSLAWQQAATPPASRWCAGDTRIILDAGTGLRTLGNERMAQNIRHSTILLSHLHWDHVAGLQFFTPIYVPGHRVEIASGPNGVMSHDAAIRSLFRAPFFPVEFDDLGGTVTTRELRANDRFEIGGITVTMARLNHPDPVYGYRLEHAGQSIVYATDTEHFACVDPTLKKLAAGADILIYDAQYTPEEYPTQGRLGPLDVGGGRRARARGGRSAARDVPPRSGSDRRTARRDRGAGRRRTAGTVAAREGMILARAMRRGRRGMTTRSCDARRG